MDEKEYNYKEYKQTQIREDMIMNDVEEANAHSRISRFSEEQIISAQEGNGKKAINELYNQLVFPLINDILFIVYCFFSIITLPLIYVDEKNSRIVAIMGYFALILVVLILKLVNKYAQERKCTKKTWMECISKFTLDMSVFAYLLTSIGYMLVIMDSFGFWFMYIIMCIVFFTGVYFDIIKPIFKKK